LILDPLMMFITERADTNQDHGIRRALAGVAMLAERQQIAVVICAHLNKDEQKRMLYRVGGSVGIVGLARSVLFLTHDPDDPDGEEGDLRLLAHAASNWARRAPTLRYRIEVVSWQEDGETITTTRLASEGESEYSAEELIASSRPREPTKTELAEDAICQALQEGPRLSSEVKAAAISVAECSLVTAERAALQLRITQVIGSSGNGPATRWHLLSQPLQPPLKHDDEGVSHHPIRIGDTEPPHHHLQEVLDGVDEGVRRDGDPTSPEAVARVLEELRRREKP
jgi:hypothetical protein